MATNNVVSTVTVYLIPQPLLCVLWQMLQEEIFQNE